MARAAGSTGRMIDAPPEFLARYPEYATTTRLDRLRETEYAYLDEFNHHYLDYTGSGLAAISQYRAHYDRLTHGCFSNPHSENPTSQAATELVDRARRKVLSYLNASPEEYTAIFTPNATGACRLVGEGYPFGRRSRLVLTFDNHNSVNGIREFARAKRAATTYIPLSGPELRISDAAVEATLGRPVTARRRRGLFGYPAQSNFSGVQHPLDWVESAQRRGYDVFLDAAAYLPTNRLDLSEVHPDFVSVSWYKLFGYPTGVGCLIARRDALARLRRPWFSGGTIQAVTVQGDWHSMAPDESAFEDGTLNFLAIPDVEFGLSWIDDVGVEIIGRRVRALSGWLLEQLGSLRHANGAPMTRVYGPMNTQARGGTVAFNFLDPDGAVIDERLVARESTAAGLSLRTGCFCNPGAGEAAFGVTRAAVRGNLRRRTLTVDQYIAALGLPSGGAVRVSFGVMSTIHDVERLLEFALIYRNRPASRTGLEPRLRC
jgi:selenocysteine lyase/cysteine desulfurase